MVQLPAPSIHPSQAQPQITQVEILLHKLTLHMHVNDIIACASPKAMHH